MAPTPTAPVFGSMNLGVRKSSLCLTAYFSSSAAGSAIGTDMHGEMIDGLLRSAGSVSPSAPAALRAVISARMAAAWPLAAGVVVSINARLKIAKAPCRLDYILFNHYIGSGGKGGQELRLLFSPMPASGARSFSLICEWGDSLHLEPAELAGLSAAEFGAILAGQSVKGIDRARLGHYYAYSRPEGVHIAWLIVNVEMPAITRLLHVLGLP